MKLKLLLFLLLIFSFSTVFSQNALLSQEAKISIFTCGNGEELYTTFGHTAIRIQDETNKLDVVYNYGQFDFREGNFYAKFVKGDLQYFIGVTSFDDFIYEYQFEGREVVEQTLNLKQLQKQKLFDVLNASLYSDERHYTYKFIDRNCTTMVVEKINAILGKPIIKKIDDKKVSYRTVLYPKFENYFWYKLGINIIFGTKVDEKSEKLFLPTEFLHSLDKAIVDGKRFVIKKQIVVKSTQPEIKFRFLDSIYFVGLLLLLVLVFNKKWITYSYLFLAGLMGLFLCLVGFYSLHEELLWNYNALLFNPLFLIFPFLKNLKWFKNSLILCFLMLLFYVIWMFNKPHLLLMSPFIIAHFIIFWQLKDKKLNAGL